MTKNNTTIILAPLQGFTDVTFRNVFSDNFSGVDEAVAPFISTMGQKRLKPSRIKDVDPENNKKLFVVPQILGNVANDFIFLADHLYEMGHKKINWNLGCPHSKIAKKNRGSGLLMYPDKIDAFLDTILPKISNTLSIKLRLGRKSKDEIFNLLPILNKYPLDEIILHPRTGIQMYEGTSDHDAFEKALLCSQHALTYNGDITDLNTFHIVQKKFPCIIRFMIGRGLLSNPFLAEDIKGVLVNKNQIDRLKKFHDDLFDNYQTIFSGPAHLTGRMKGFWRYLGPSFKDSRKQLKKILKADSITKYQDMVEAFFKTETEFIKK
ncbi:MAG: tRNA-dihydrouridine synthase family protein [Deltaproteobacteria bacterium]|uniref:tRNA-dihydrouridine synthase n=1 Tax=Desulfobacula sp. TaxID=2593537 RepID=UPI00198E732E|nr:tRNA-dihydrouridine synthase family protein [Candidatus Desulfobacula maris]MBL6993489.1 tRNA-dihydrouridine synthase family protein [Desulfobacula sp.]